MVKANESSTPSIPDLDKLWSNWDLGINEKGKDEVSERLGSVSLDDSNDKPNPSIQKLKLAVFKDVILYYNKNDQEQYDKIMKDLQSPQVGKFAIDTRLERAKEGKEAANKKYKDGYKLEAMFTYAVAWGLLLPYYPEHYPKANAKGSQSSKEKEDYRDEIGKLECALFSNIAAMALLLYKDSDVTPEQKESLGQIGIDSSQICISAKEFVSVGIMSKSCRRAREIAETIPSTSTRAVPKDKLRFFTEQEEKLKEVKDEKQLFSQIASTHSASPAKI